MAFQLSPGVNVTEKDLTLIVPAVATTPGAMVGPFQWGPADEPVLVSNEKALAEKFGGPLSSLTEEVVDYAGFWFTASNFLAYGNNLRIVRALSKNYHTAVNTEAVNTEGIGYPVTETVKGFWTGIFNDKSASEITPTSELKVSAKYPGKLGNGIQVVIIDADYQFSSTNGDVNYLTFFDTAPKTSQYVRSITNRNDVNDEVHVLVIDGDGVWTGVKGTILERFAYLSKAIDAKKPDGTNNYYVNIINNNSEYVRMFNHPDLSGSGLDWGSSVLDIDESNSFKVLEEKVEEYVLRGGSLEGSDWDGVFESELEQFYETHFADSETSDVSLLLAGPVGAPAARNLIQLAEKRKDCIAFVSPRPTSSSGRSVASMGLEDILTYRSATGINISSSYGVMDSGYKLQYDRYNDVFRYVPLCGDIAGTCVYTDDVRDPWFSPAGFDRGRIKNVVRLAFNPNKTERDELYKVGVNPVTSFQGQGTVLFGDKTLLDRPSAFDRINVRRLFIVLEKAIATASKFLLFEFNDEFTRAQFVALVEPFLRDVQARRGVFDFRVVCDETNNTPQVIDSNSFVGDIYIKPTRSINFIQLNFIATPTGVSFEEVQGA
jgi:phage tail sheath protein FI